MTISRLGNPLERYCTRSLNDFVNLTHLNGNSAKIGRNIKMTYPLNTPWPYTS